MLEKIKLPPGHAFRSKKYYAVEKIEYDQYLTQNTANDKTL